MNIDHENREEWKKFIQINIYGRTLGELQRNGVDLKSLLNNIGCSKNWITEGSMYNGDSDSGLDSSFEDTTPIFSSTIANDNYPRCSTPMASRMHSKMTLCTSRILSRVSVNSDHSDISHIDEETARRSITSCDNSLKLSSTNDSGIIKKLLDEMLERVGMSLDRNNVQAEPEHFDTVYESFPENEPEDITDFVSQASIYPRCSTPNHTGRQPKFGPCVSVSKITLNPAANTTSQGREDYDVKEDLDDISESRRSVMNGSAEVDMNRNVDDSPPAKKVGSFESFLNRINRNKLKRTTSDANKGREKAIRVSRRNTMNPLLVVGRRLSSKKVTKSVNSLRQLSTESEKVYGDLTPVSSNGQNNEQYENWLQAPHVLENLGEYFAEQENMQLNTGEEHEEYPQGGDYWTDAPEMFDTAGDANNTVDISPLQENEDAFEDFHGLDESDSDDIPNKTQLKPISRPQSILVGSSRTSITEPRTNKKVSFAIQVGPNLDIMTPVQYKKYINKSRLIKCQYKGCKKTYNWKIKYGKLRLVDHALTHIDRRIISCRLCEKTTQTVRQMRNHYEKAHENERMTGYGMKDLPVEENDVRDIWNVCYKDQIHIVGEASKKPTHIRIKRKKEEEEEEEAENEEDETVQNPVKDEDEDETEQNENDDNA